MRKTTIGLALVLAMIAAPLAAADRTSDRASAPLAGLWTWVLGLVKHGPDIAAPAESAGADARGKHGAVIIHDGFAATPPPEAIPDGSVPGTADG